MPPHVDRPGKMGVISCEWFRILFAYLDTGIVHAKSVNLRFFSGGRVPGSHSW